MWRDKDSKVIEEVMKLLPDSKDLWAYTISLEGGEIFGSTKKR